MFTGGTIWILTHGHMGVSVVWIPFETTKKGTRQTHISKRSVVS